MFYGANISAARPRASRIGRTASVTMNSGRLDAPLWTTRLIGTALVAAAASAVPIAIVVNNGPSALAQFVVVLVVLPSLLARGLAA